jgi:hypothetical protein
MTERSDNEELIKERGDEKSNVILYDIQTYMNWSNEISLSKVRLLIVFILAR